ncbi:MAG: hypothetical protein QOG04_1125 [Actinomycetota bacterium]|jgi:hypothetical protein|nr:hypothetical protein [Actinomycetota bacterium]
MRRTFLSILTGVLTGTLVLGVAWATAGLVPARPAASLTDTHKALDADAQLEDVAGIQQAIQAGGRLPGGTFLVGADDESIAPIPVSDGGDWNADGNLDGTNYDCGSFEFEYTPTSDPSCIRTFDRVWATGVDELGIKARALAISNGETTVAFVVIDTVSWFYGYDPSICPDNSTPPQDTCGSRAITQSLSQEFAAEGIDIPAKNFVIAATHTHASADTTSKTPSWYYLFVRDQIKEALRNAVHSMQPAELQTGAIPAKAFNVDRRIVTRAVPDAELTWVRAVALPPGDSASGGNPGAVHPGDTITTLVNFGVHPTVTASNAVMHSGFIGHLAKKLEELWGGTTVFMPGGLGDQTVNRGFGRDGIGYGLANYVYESAQNNTYTMKSNEIVTEQRILTIPADNDSLVAANKAGIFMRDTTVPGPHAAGPSQSIQQKGDANTPSCVSAGPISVLSPIGGIRIGTPGIPQGADGFVPGDRGDALVFMEAPGEIFSSISLTTKDYLSRARNVMVFGMANDHIGYIIPAQQYDIRAANAAGIAAPSHNMTDYEESLSTGRCTGDQVQNALIEIGSNLGVLGSGEGR